MVIAHLTSSSFFGGPERQMVGLARAIAPEHRSIFLAFAEGGRCAALLREVADHGFAGIRLAENYPHFRRVSREIAGILKDNHADVLCCHGYKADLIGLLAVRTAGVPVVSVSHGWTRATRKVAINEAADRFCLRWMDAVVAVSGAQAAKILRTGAPRRGTYVILNAVDVGRFLPNSVQEADRLQKLFPTRRSGIVLALARLSVEKGIGDLVEAAAIAVREKPGIGFVIAGEGPLRESLSTLIDRRGLRDHVILAGFCDDVEQMIPCADLLAIPSYDEGLPTVLLESLAAGVPVIATPVGGIPEVLQDGVHGLLTPVADPAELARNILTLVADRPLRLEMGRRGRELIRERFTFEQQKEHYLELFESLSCMKTDCTNSCVDAPRRSNVGAS